MLKKNRLRKPTCLAVHADLAVDTWTQIRRCHRCLLAVEANGERVLACPGCRAHFAPYFFADLTPEALAEARFVFKSKPASLVLSTAKRYRPIVGISWWWNDANSPSGEPVMPRA
ncbi:hypothetical protein BH10BDE1_BH10BDE1_00540 [soil metagenome]